MNAPLPGLSATRSAPFVGEPFHERLEATLTGEPGTGYVAAALVACFRHHPHVNNVLTHLSGGRWDRIGDAIGSIINPTIVADELPPLALNILDLLCAERGVTGRIVKPYLESCLRRICQPELAGAILLHVDGLFTASTWEEGRRRRARPSPGKPGTAALRNSV